MRHVLCVALLCGACSHDNGATRAPLSPATRALDPEIAALLPAVSSANLGAGAMALSAFPTRNTCSGAGAIFAARDWVQARLSSVAGAMVALDDFSTAVCGGGPVVRQNVLGWLPGATHPERLIIVGGHYDSRSTNVLDGAQPAPGANDSGSQTSLVLEAARVLAGHRFAATLVFVAFAGEEQGLLGSASFARNVQTRFPGAQVVAMLNCDIVGGDSATNDAAALAQFRLYSPGTPREIHGADGTPDDTSPSRGLMRYVGDWGASYMPSLAMLPKLREDRPGRGGDHESFIAAGFPGVRFIETAENLAHEHTGDDLFAHLTPEYTASLARVVISVAASLARAPATPAGLTASGTPAQLSLGWSPSSDADHYVLAARPVGENLYRQRLSVPAGATSATVGAADLSVAGGAFFVSVAAVDAAGHESLFAFPEWRCDDSGCSVPAAALDITATH